MCVRVCLVIDERANRFSQLQETPPMPPFDMKRRCAICDFKKFFAVYRKNPAITSGVIPHVSSNQTAQLNLVISAKDEAQPIIAEFVKSVEASVKSLRESLDSLNAFKFKNPISQSTVTSIKTRVNEINEALSTMHTPKATENVGTSPLASEAASAKSDSTTIVAAMKAVSSEAQTMRKALDTSGVKLLPPGVANSLIPVKNAIKAFVSEVRTDTSPIESDVRGWGRAFATLVVDVEKDANGVYTAVSDIKRSVASATASIDDLKKSVNKVDLVFKILPDDVEGAMNKAASDVGTNTTKIVDDMQTVNKRVKETKDAMRKGFDFMQLQFAGQQMQEWGRTVTDFTGKMIDSAANFSQLIMNIGGSLRAQGESAKQVNAQLRPMNDYLLQLASSGYFMKSEVADAFNVMAKQGISYNAIMGGALKAATDVAAANQESLTATANVISDIIHEMGGSLLQQYGNIGSAMQHVGDQMTVALHHSRISMNDFLGSMKYAGPQASALGVNFSQLAASIAVLGQHGIRSYQAGTTLRRMLTNLTPTSAAAATEMQNLGLITAKGGNIFYDATGHLKSLADVQAILHDKLASLSPEMQQFSLKTIFGQYALSGMTAIANTTPAAFQAMTKAMAQNGTAQAILAEKSKGVGMQLKHLSAQYGTLLVQIGESFLPMVTKVVGALTSLMATIQKFVALHPVMSKMLAVFGATMGVVMLGGGAIANLMGTLGMFKTAIVDLIPALSAVEIGFGPLLLIVAAVGVAVAGLYLAWKNNVGGIRDLTKQAIQGVVSWFKRISPELAQLKSEITSVLNFLSPVWKTFWGTFKTVADTVGKALIAIIKGDWQIISGVFSLFLDLLTLHWGKEWQDVQQIFNGFKTIFTGVFKVFIQGISSLLKIELTMWEGLWANTWKLVGGSATSAWKSIASGLSSFVKGVQDAWKAFTDALQHVFQAFIDLFEGNVKGFWTNIRSAFETGIQPVRAAFQTLWKDINDLFGGLPSQAFQWGENMIHMFVQGIQSAIGNVGKAISGVASTVKKFLGFHSPTEEGPASDSDQWMPNMMKMFQTGITQQIPALKSTLGNVALSMQQTLTAPNTLGSSHVANTYNLASSTQNRAPVTININVDGRNKNDKQLVDAFAKIIRTQMAVVSA